MTSADLVAPRSRFRQRILSIGMFIALVSTTLLSLASVGWKMLCTGPVYGANGATELEISRYGTLLCYSDQRALWGARDLIAHAFPYDGSFLPGGGLTGGVVEYPVLSGVFMWIVALPAQTDRGFVIAAGLALAVAAVVVAFLLYGLVGARAFLWAAAPAVAVYSAYNVDVLPALATVVGLAILLWPTDRLSPVLRAYLAAVAFGIGAGLKLYPLMFALPVAIWIASRANKGGRPHWGHAVGVLATAGGVLLLANAPFAIWQTEGWLASFQFQSVRLLDDNTMAIWWWVPHLFGFEVSDHTARLTVVAALATAVGLTAAVVYGFQVQRRTSVYPWLQVSAAMLVAYMLLNKVNSPQYILWLIPFFVLLRVPMRGVLLYFVADLAVFFGYFRRFALVPDSSQLAGIDILLGVGILLRAALLAYFFFAFLHSDKAGGRASEPVSKRGDPQTSEYSVVETSAR